MRTISYQDFEAQKSGFISLIKSGAVFIYPTDTIYGMGCNALLSPSVKLIRDAKNRPTTPFSIIAPSIEWIREYCEIPQEAEEWIHRLPGPYTLVFKLKRQDSLTKEIAPGLTAIGVRIPKHWISKVVAQIGDPIITTSVNKRGLAHMTSLENLDPDIEKHIDFIIYEGEKNGKPSQIVRFDEGSPQIIRG